VTDNRAAAPIRRTVGAPELLRSVGLMADGPVPWGRAVPSGKPGVFVVEWPEPLPSAPVELTLVGKWLERLPGLRLDGRRPTTRELAARLHDFWLPGQVVVYVAMSPGPIGGRVASMVRTQLGDRRPYPNALWLRTLRGLDRTRFWWAETTAPEEYEDAVLGAFGAGIDASEEALPRLPDRTLILPFANLQSSTGLRKPHGITGAIEPKPAEPTVAAPGSRIVELPEGAADGVADATPDRPMEVRTPSPRPPSQQPAATPPPISTTGRAASVDFTALNDALQTLACQRLARELMVGDAASELSALGFLRGTRAQPVAVLRDLLKQGLIEGGVQDTDRRWTIRCVRRSD
jgi:hypothetical protein